METAACGVQTHGRSSSSPWPRPMSHTLDLIDQYYIKFFNNPFILKMMMKIMKSRFNDKTGELYQLLNMAIHLDPLPFAAFHIYFLDSRPRKRWPQTSLAFFIRDPCAAKQSIYWTVQKLARTVLFKVSEPQSYFLTLLRTFSKDEGDSNSLSAFVPGSFMRQLARPS